VLALYDKGDDMLLCSFVLFCVFLFRLLCLRGGGRFNYRLINVIVPTLGLDLFIHTRKVPEKRLILDSYLAGRAHATKCVCGGTVLDDRLLPRPHRSCCCYYLFVKQPTLHSQLFTLFLPRCLSKEEDFCCKRKQLVCATSQFIS
jgi:hypothetical protein